MLSELEPWKACRLYHSSQVLDLAPGKGEDNGRLSEWFLGWKSFPALLDRVPQEKPAAHFPGTPRKFFALAREFSTFFVPTFPVGRLGLPETRRLPQEKTSRCCLC